MADRDPHRLRTLAIVPALNEQHAIPGVIADIRDADPSIDVVIVDDGSTDATAEVARAAGARVIRLPFNLGIGGAVQTGFRVARDEGYDVAIQIDGDGQHPADQVDTLLAAVRAGANYVIGSRFAAPSEYRASRARRSGMILLSRLVSLIVRARITDTTSGFRAADKRTIGLFASHYPHDYPEVEAIVLARRNGLRVQEVPVLMRARTTGRSSITPLKSGYYMAKVVLAVLVQCLGRAPRRDEGELER